MPNSIPAVRQKARAWQNTRRILPLPLAFDHRVVDGADAARFTTEAIRSLENPLQLISLG